MELILVRHAEPIEETRNDGSPADPPLSDRGRAQARAVADWLSLRGVDRVLSSPALRARQTARETARRAGLEISVEDRLCDANAQADVAEVLDEWTSRCRGERVAVFCHGSVVNVYASRVLGLESQAFLEADYASGHRFLISGTGVRSVLSLNETAYLPI